MLAKNSLESGNYTQSIEKYEQLEVKYPFSRFSDEAKIELAYAKYQNGNFDDARKILSNFIKYHPNYKNIDYVYFLYGITSYYSNKSYINLVFTYDPSTKDTSVLHKAWKIKISRLMKKL